MKTESKCLTSWMTPSKGGGLFSELEEGIFLEIMEHMPIEEVVDVFENMAADDAAELLGHLDEEFSDAILEKMNNEDSLEVEHLMSYGEDSAGSIMVPDFIALKEDHGGPGCH